MFLDRKRDQWKRNSINWPAFFLIIVMAIALGIGGLILNSTDLASAIRARSDLQVTLSKTEAERNALKKQFDAVGTKPYVESRARSEDHYLRENEIRFRVKDPEKLDNYTDEEWDILIKELATRKR